MSVIPKVPGTKVPAMKPSEAKPTGVGDPCRVVDRGPNWLILRLSEEALTPAVLISLSDRLWDIASRHFTYRLVLELDELGALRPNAIEELVILQRRLLEHGGALRLCGLRPDCAKALMRSVRSDSLANNADRHAAVGDSWCGGPSKPPASAEPEPGASKPKVSKPKAQTRPTLDEPKGRREKGGKPR